MGHPLTRAAQGNFDHLMGQLRKIADAHNLTVQDVADLYEALGLEQGVGGPSGGGIPGLGGSPGANGEDGTPGIDGLDGNKGRDGLDGIDGTIGKDGKDGLPGMDGQKGDTGATGATGAAGSIGRDGVDGLDETPGVTLLGDDYDTGNPAVRGGVKKLKFATGPFFIRDEGSTQTVELNSGSLQQLSVFLSASEIAACQDHAAAAAWRGTDPDQAKTWNLADGSTTGIAWDWFTPPDLNLDNAVTMDIIYAVTTAESAKAVRLSTNFTSVDMDAADDVDEAGSTLLATVALADPTVANELYTYRAVSEVPPSNNSLIRCEFHRIGANAADTFLGNFHVVGVLITYYTNLPAGVQGAAGDDGEAGRDGLDGLDSAYQTNVKTLVYNSPLIAIDGDQAADYAAYNYTIHRVWGVSEVARGGDITIDLEVNGVSVGWASAPTIPAAGGVGTEKAPTAAAVNKGDKVVVNFTGTDATEGRAQVKMRVVAT